MPTTRAEIKAANAEIEAALCKYMSTSITDYAGIETIPNITDVLNRVTNAARHMLVREYEHPHQVAADRRYLDAMRILDAETS